MGVDEAPGPGTLRRQFPTVRVDEARIEDPAPRREFSPAQALDLVRRSAIRRRDDPGPRP